MSDLRGRVTAGVRQLAITTPAVRQTWQGLSAYAYLYVEDAQVREPADLVGRASTEIEADLRAARAEDGS